MNHSIFREDIGTANVCTPCIKAADIDAAIASDHYFTAYEGVAGHGKLDQREMAHIPNFDYLKLTTFCVLVLRNGYSVTGVSHCADASVFKAEIGREYALADAKEKVGALLAYGRKETSNG
jgi:hypothetical protein